MEAKPLTPVEIFQGEKRYLVPLFQRPYVWTREEQWEPLWADVRRLADELLRTGQAPRHFLGAIVMEQLSSLGGYHHMWSLIDGQQRLTTLQLLLDATELVVHERGAANDSQALRLLITNSIGTDEERFKVWPTNRDRAAFAAAMLDERPVPAAVRQAPLVEAHQYFQDAVSSWAGEDNVESRLHALTAVLREHLTVVGINLDQSDNAQVIFETLNFRGAPLLAADLIKNHLFQRASTEGKNVERLYDRYWEPLDDPYWREDVRQGRFTRPRIDVFLSHWLVMHLGTEVASDRIFSEFTEKVSTTGTDVETVMANLSAHARTYRTFMEAPLGSSDELFRHRVLDVLDSNAVMPVVLWLLVHDVSLEQRRIAFSALESWLTRRALLRLGTRDLTHLVIELVRQLTAQDAPAGEVVCNHLLGQASSSQHWPDDAYLRAELTDIPAYRAFRRPLNRMLLEAAEDTIRAGRMGEGQSCPRDLSVEHVMPQSWQANWPLPEDADEDAAAVRTALVQTLGNLTLVTGAHNSSLSNRPWLAADAKGKRDYLLANSTLKLNADITQQHRESWTEDDIRSRTQQLIDAILVTWPRPMSEIKTADVLGERRRESRTTEPRTYERHAVSVDGTTVGPLDGGAAIDHVLRHLIARGVPLAGVVEQVGENCLLRFPGHLTAAQVGERLLSQDRSEPDVAGAWRLEHLHREGDATWVWMAHWPRAAEVLHRLARMAPDITVSQVAAATPDGRVGWPLEDVLEALADQPHVARTFRAMLASSRESGRPMGGSSASAPSWIFGVETDDGIAWTYVWHAHRANAPLRVVFDVLGKVTPTAREDFLDAVAGVLPTLPAEDVRSNGFRRRPLVSADDLIDPGVGQALEDALDILAARSGPRWWGIHNDHFTFDELADQGFISIGWDATGDLSRIASDRTALKDALRSSYSDAGEQAISVWAGMISHFVTDLRPGDLVVAADKTARTLNIGEVAGHYWFAEDADAHRHRVPVHWLVTRIPRERFSQEALNELGSALTLFRIRRAVTELENHLHPAAETEPQP